MLYIWFYLSSYWSAVRLNRVFYSGSMFQFCLKLLAKSQTENMSIAAALYFNLLFKARLGFPRKTRRGQA